MDRANESEREVQVQIAALKVQYYLKTKKSPE